MHLSGGTGAAPALPALLLITTGALSLRFIPQQGLGGRSEAQERGLARAEHCFAVSKQELVMLGPPATPCLGSLHPIGCRRVLCLQVWTPARWTKPRAPTHLCLKYGHVHTHTSTRTPLSTCATDMGTHMCAHTSAGMSTPSHSFPCLPAKARGSGQQGRNACPPPWHGSGTSGGDRRGREMFFLVPTKLKSGSFPPSTCDGKQHHSGTAFTC